MLNVAGRVMLALLLVVLSGPPVHGQRAAVPAAFAGVSNHGRHKHQPYVTAGDRTYLIGTQDGAFPDLGGHVRGEMGGLWLHPIKLIDGFRARLTDAAARRDTVLAEAADFVAFPYGSRFDYGPVLDSVTVERFELSPDGQNGLVVQYIVRNASARPRQLSLQFTVKTDLRPVWMSDSLGIRDAPDTVTWQSSRHVFVARDTRNPWFCVWGATSRTGELVAHPEAVRTAGQGVTAASRYTLPVAPHGNSTLTFVIAGSFTDEASALRTFAQIARTHTHLLEQKKAHYAALLTEARITIPDKRLQQVYDWVRIDNQWLVRDVPGMGRGVGAGLPEYPWWFPDMYTAQALIATGDFRLTKETLRLLWRQSMKANGNGRIVHEVTTNGFVGNHGNTQETAQYVMTVGQLIDWTADTAFAREMYPAMQKSLHWLLTDADTNGDLFPEGYGIMEVLGLNAELIDAAVYTQQALEETSHVAAFLHDSAAVLRYDSLSSLLATKINNRFWLENRESYADFYGTRAQAVSAAEGAIEQIKLGEDATPIARDSQLIAYYEQLGRRFAAKPDTSRGWITNENWVIATPMEMGIAPRDRAIRLLDRIRKDNVGAYGPYLSAVERQAMMTISTGVEAEAEARYGRSDDALWYMNKIAETFGTRSPGTISEMMPDYGNFVIAWTSYGIVVPLVEQFFGIMPNAPEKIVVLDPHPPTGWDDMAIRDLPVGATRISFTRTRTAKGMAYDVRAKDDGWTFVLRSKAGPGAQYSLNGRRVPYDSSGIRMSGRHNRLVVVP